MDTQPDPPAPEGERIPTAGAEPGAIEQTEDAPPVQPASSPPEPPAVAPEKPAAAPEKPAAAPEPPAAAPEKPAAAPEPPAAAPEKPAAAPEKPAAPRRRRWPRVLAALFGVLLGAAVALALIAPGYLRDRIKEDAKKRGITLMFVELRAELWQIHLEGVSVRLDGVPDFAASAASVDIDIVDWEPGAVRVGELALTLSGTDVLRDLAAWKTAHPSALSMPISAQGARIDWSPARGAEPAVTLDGARVSVAPEKGTIDASGAAVSGRAAGPVKVDWALPQGGLTVQIRPSAPPLSALSAEIRAMDSDPPRVKLVLARTQLAPLAAALGVPPGSEGLVADAEVEAPLPSIEKPAPVQGALRVSVKGYVPPHPRDLDGILFGDVTTLKSQFTLAEDYSGAKLTSTAVEAGALALSGSGEVTREGFDALVSLKLKGSIPCTSLATSAAVARLGRGLGGLAGGLAAAALRGSVSVALSIEARASDIKGAKISQSAHIGCKVTVPGLGSIVIK